MAHLQHKQFKSELWDDEETRQFYEELLDLGSTIPSFLLKNEEGASTDATEESTSSVRVEEQVVGGPKNSDSKQPTMEAIINRLPECYNKEEIDRLAEDFCYLNSSKNRKKLVTALFSAPRGQLELLPLYARLAATLSRHIKDIGEPLIEKLQSEFGYILYKHEQLEIDSKIRNAKFIGELAKFPRVPSSLAFEYDSKMY